MNAVRVETVALVRALAQLLHATAEHRPVSAGSQALQQVHETRILADQNAWLVLLDALDDAPCGGRRGLGKAVEAFDRLGAAGIIVDAAAGARVARDVGGDAT